MQHPEIEPEHQAVWLMKFWPTEMLEVLPAFDKWTPTVLGNVKGVITHTQNEKHREQRTQLLLDFIEFVIRTEMIPDLCVNVPIREIFIDYC